jgi:hypothetical protein
MLKNDARLNVRLSHDELLSVKHAATASGMTVSAYSRRRILGHVVTSKADDMMIRELRRLGGLLKHVHNESDGAYSVETAEAIGDIRIAIGGFSRDQ